MKLFINRNLGTERMKELEDMGYDIIYVPERDFRNLKREDVEAWDNIDEIYSADVWFTYMGFDQFDITKMKNLKYVHLTSAGINQVPVEHLIKKDIILSNNTTGYAIPMAESVVMYILEVYKNSRKMFKYQDSKTWRTDMSWIELSGKRVGFLGTGNIAQEAVKRLRAFDVVLWGVNTNGRSIDGFDRCFSIDNCDEFFRECDVIVGIMPATESTTGLIDDEKMLLMKEGSTLINIGRGNLINEDDLEKNISKFRGVVLDVVEEEPLSTESKLWEFENVIITPHNCWVSENNIERLADRVIENMKSFIETGKPKTYLKDIKRGY